ncbi:MAG: GntR family transcriptional regulator [Gemmatimonadota bacterium]|nr:GntR family transcriptional regulator [Gemmatimonadota bacterium]
MLVTLDNRDVRPLYLQIMDEIRRAIVVGKLKPEDPLPSVRDLASELVINPRTVSQAYQELEREEVVYVKRGQGTFVAPTRKNSRERQNLARAVAKRTLIEARRSGLDVLELIATLKEVAAEEKE